MAQYCRETLETYECIGRNDTELKADLVPNHSETRREIPLKIQCRRARFFIPKFKFFWYTLWLGLLAIYGRRRCLGAKLDNSHTLAKTSDFKTIVQGDDMRI